MVSICGLVLAALTHAATPLNDVDRKPYIDAFVRKQQETQTYEATLKQTLRLRGLKEPVESEGRVSIGQGAARAGKGCIGGRTCEAREYGATQFLNYLAIPKSLCGVGGRDQRGRKSAPSMSSQTTIGRSAGRKPQRRHGPEQRQRPGAQQLDKQ